MSVPLRVKWGKETYDVDLNVGGDNGGGGAKATAALKAELEERTGVPSDRMKLMPKSKGLWKGVLKDDFDLSTVDFGAALAREKGPSPRLNVLLMGSATKLAGPKKKTVFIEDLPPEEVAKHIKEPSGLVNLGNTCYLNSVVQCLRGCRFLRSALNGYPYASNVRQPGAVAASAGARRSQPHPLVTSLRDLLGNLDRTPTSVSPTNFVMATKMAFPQFAQTGPQGQPMQQDAEEFYSGLLALCAEEMSGRDAIARGFDGDVPGEDALMGAANVVDAVFGMRMEETLTCDELGGRGVVDVSAADAGGDDGAAAAAAAAAAVEPPVKSYDLLRKLVCNIQGGSEQAAAGGDSSSSASAPPVNVNHIQEGIELSLNGKIEKRSEVLGRDAVWTRTQRIARLPPIITVQFGRFYWKLTPNSQDHSGVKCKVMKPVAFHSTMDVYSFCTEKLQKVLKVHRDKALAEEEDRIAKKLKDQIADSSAESAEPMDTSGDPTGEDKNEAAASEAKAGEDIVTDEDEEEAAALRAAMAMSMEAEQPPVGPGLPANFQGVYELFAVVTHKGRDADGGHYMGWVKADTGADDGAAHDDWFVFDDDEVSPCKTEDVLKLKGGGDWHMSYLNFYRAKAGGFGSEPGKEES